MQKVKRRAIQIQKLKKEKLYEYKYKSTENRGCLIQCLMNKVQGLPYKSIDNALLFGGLRYMIFATGKREGRLKLRNEKLDRRNRNLCFRIAWDSM